MLAILKQSQNLKCLGLVNCKQLFMSGTFLNTLNDRYDLKNVLQNLEELVLDHNSYLSDVLLLRIVSSLHQLQSLRYVYQLTAIMKCMYEHKPAVLTIPVKYFLA